MSEQSVKSAHHWRVWLRFKIKQSSCAAEQLDSHFLEEVPVGDDLELLQDEEDAATDEEGLVFGQSFVEQQQIPLTGNQKQTSVNAAVDVMSLPVSRPGCSPHGFGHIGELHEVVLPQQLMSRHVTLRKHQQRHFQSCFMS